MTTSWQDLIRQRPHDSIDYTALDSVACFMPLDQLGVLTVAGEDSHAFLQSLLTNDITLLADQDTQYSGFCTPKGRLLALFLIIRASETSYQLVLPKSLCEAMAKRLAMYVLRSKATITNASDSLVCVGSTQSEPSLPSALAYHVLSAQVHRGLIICPVEEADALCQSLIDQQYQLQSSHYWEWLDITAEIAKVVPETQEKFTPQQLNLDITHAVNFQKGCYPGQEVVARLHYLGKASRRLFTAEVSASVLAEMGSEVMTTEGQVAGHLVSAAQQDEQYFVCLISLKLSAFESDLLLAGEPLRLTSKLVD